MIWITVSYWTEKNYCNNALKSIMIFIALRVHPLPPPSPTLLWSFGGKHHLSLFITAWLIIIIAYDCSLTVRLYSKCLVTLICQLVRQITMIYALPHKKLFLDPPPLFRWQTHPLSKRIYPSPSPFPKPHPPHKPYPLTWFQLGYYEFDVEWWIVFNGLPHQLNARYSKRYRLPFSITWRR